MSGFLTKKASSPSAIHFQAKIHARYSVAQVRKVFRTNRTVSLYSSSFVKEKSIGLYCAGRNVSKIESI